MKQTCKQCGKTFELTDSEINFYKSKNLNIPKRCKQCRDNNKKANGNDDNKKSDAFSSSSVCRSSYSGKSEINKGTIIGIGVIALALIIAVVICIFATGDKTPNYIAGTSANNVSDSTENNNYANNNSISSDEGLASDDSTQHESQPDVNNDSKLDESQPDDNKVDESQPDVTEDNKEDESQPDATEDNKVDANKPDANDNVKADESQPKVTEDTKTPESKTEAAVTPSYRFRNEKLLNEHYEKHGKEMGFASPAQYEQAAAAVINNQAALRKTEAEDGDYVFYVEATNEFVVLSTDGYIRTYFLPSGGKAYYDRQ